MLFALHAIDRTDVPGLRAATRPEHLVYLQGFGVKIVLAGPLLAFDGTTPIGSLVVFDARDRVEAEAMVAGDPYSKAGLFATVMISPLRVGIQNLPVAAP